MASLRSSGFVDPGWEYGVAQDEKKKKVKCNFCGKIVSGGIYRLKQHLARVSGEVTYCERAPEEVCLKMKDNLDGSRSNRRQRHIEEVDTYLLSRVYDGREEVEEHYDYKSKGKRSADSKNLLVDFTPLRSSGYVDPGWEHGVAQDERKKKVKCNYCEKIVSGGINRFKQHIARIPGEVAPCKNAPEEVYMKIKDNMKWHRTGRRHRRPDDSEMSSFYMHDEEENEEYDQEEDADHCMSSEKMTTVNQRYGKDLLRTFRGMPSSSVSEPAFKRPRLDSFILRSTKNQLSPTFREANLKSGPSRKDRKEVVSAIRKFFFHAGVPESAVHSSYFHKMLELVGQYGPNSVCIPNDLLSGRCLEEELVSMKNYHAEYKASMSDTGCSVLADSWRNVQGRIMLNFLVSCPRGLYFHSTADVTDISEDASKLFKLLDKVVEDIGQENVVQVVTANTASFKDAGKMIEDKHRNLYWSPCAIYCIERIFEDFLEIKWVRECVEKGQKITKLIYNQSWLLNLMKSEFTDDQELLRPVATPLASSFATVQGLQEHRIALKRMFQSSKWISSRCFTSDEGKEVVKIVNSAPFWKKIHYVSKTVDPILRLLPKSNDVVTFSMASIYDDMYKAKLAIKSIHGDDECKYGPFWNIINNHWDSSFQHPLYLAAYFLNPSYRYRPDFMQHPDVTRALNECISRLETDKVRKISASMQISDYTCARADFGTELAISTRTELDPASWWQQHGINCLELQRIAVRILSQTCSSVGCEHNWSIFDQLYNQRHNALAQKKLNDTIYVHYNLRLREQQWKRRFSDSPSLDTILEGGLLDDWIVGSEKQVIQEDEEIFYADMEQKDALEQEFIEYEEGTIDAQKDPSEMMAMVEAHPLALPVSNGCQASDEDEDLDFLDEDFSS
ncbi:unnamed protein product [Rhodiola kirilowii]